MAKLDSLVVDLKVETAELRKGLDAANAKLSSFGKAVNSIGQTVSFAALGAVVKQASQKLADFVLKGAQAADHMGKMATAAGVPVEELSRLGYAADLGGSSSEELGAALQKLNRNLAEAGAGGKEQTALFRALGVSVKDSSGNVRTASDVFKSVADKFAGLQDGPSKAALAMELFGKQGTKLLPTLNEGAAGLAKLAAESDRFGTTITASAVAATAEFNDNLTRLEKASEGVAARVAADLAPALTKLTSDLLSSKEGADFLRGAADALAASIKVLASAGVIVGAVFEAAGKNIAAGGAALYSVVNGDFSGALQIGKDYLSQTVADAKAAASRVGDIWTASGSSATEAAKKTEAATKKSADGIVAGIERQKKALAEYEQALKSLTKVAEDYEAKVSSFGVGPLEELENRLATGDLSKELAKIGSAADDMRERILAAAQALQSLEISEVQTRLDFEQREQQRSTAIDIGSRRQAMANVGVDPLAVLQQATAGFASFNDALEVLAKQTEVHTRRMGEAEMLRITGDKAGAQAAMEAATNAKMLADRAATASDAFRAVSEAANQAAKQLEDQRKQMAKTFGGAIGSAIYGATGGTTQDQLDAANSLGNNFAGKTGQLGNVANTAMQGFQVGGIWGAIIAAVAELLSGTEEFAKLVAGWNEDLKMVADALGPALKAFTELGDAAKPVTKAISEVLGSLIEFLNSIHNVDKIGRSLKPIMNAIGNALKPVAMILDAFGKLFEAISFLEPVIVILAVIFNFISLTILGTINIIELAWLEISSFLAGFLMELTKVIPLDAFKDWAASLTKMSLETRVNNAKTQAKMTKIWENITDPEGGPADEFDGAGLGVVEFNDKLGDATATVNKFTQAFTNLPAGFKVAARRFQAQDPVGAAGGGGGMLPLPNVSVYISGGVMTTIQDIKNAVVTAIQREQFNDDGVITTFKK